LKTYRNLLIFFAVLALLPVFARNNNYLIHIFVMILMFAYFSTSWNILGGFTGHFALGNGTYVGIGGYVTVLLFKENMISPWMGFFIGGLIAGIISLILSYPCFKLKGSYYTLSTLAFLYVINIFVLNQDVVFGYETGSSMGLKVPWRGGFANMQFMSKISYFYIILIMLVAVLALCIYIKKSKTGYYFASIVTNQDAAAAVGVPVMGYKLLAQFLSAFFSALGGGFYGMFIMFLDANRVLGQALSTEILLFAVIGGKTSAWGPVVGAFILVPINEILRSKLGATMAGLPMVIYGIIFVLVICFLPGGLFSGLKKLAGKIGIFGYRYSGTEAFDD
jgi:branched-chain amino acid transport system permease protein